MIQWIIRKVIPDHNDLTNPKVREAYTVLSGVLGIGINSLLFGLKLAIGLLGNSIAVISDAFNNLTDMASSIVTIFGAKLSSRPPDDEHPHGHGRYEYIASLVVSFIIFVVGFELLQSSFGKIVRPPDVELSWLMVVILIITVLLKLWMYSYNKFIGKKINSNLNQAIAVDSLNDVFATSAVIIGSVVNVYIRLPLDGIMGVVISGLIMYTGFTTARDSVNLLVGIAADPDLVGKIYELVLEGSTIRGAHDLHIHDYGPNQVVASIHAEVVDYSSLVDSHLEIDAIERKIAAELGVKIVIHVDPV